MMRSMYTAVAGLRTHQGKMDTIGNNIANVNTVGFKRGQVTFKEAFSQTMTGASAPHGGKGGTNPVQIGMGVGLGSINTIHTVGNGQKTDNPTDLMINGEGFFTVANDTGFNNRYYTRAGNFSLDRDGNLVTQDGDKVLGYGIGEDGKIDESAIRGIRVNKSDTVGAKATENIQIRGNLDSRSEDGTIQTMDTVTYDSLGNQYKLTFQLKKGATDTEKNTTWKMDLIRVTDVATGNYMDEIGTEGVGDDQVNVIKPILGFTQELKFDSNGKIKDLEKKVDKVDIKFSDLEFNKGKNKNDLGNSIKPSGSLSNITIFDPNNAETYDKLTQYAIDTDIQPYRMNGNTAGTLDGFSIDGTGTVMGIFTNGERRALGQLMLTKFDNPVGLEKVGNNTFVDTRNSGEPQNGTAGGRGFGAIDGGTLEMSNVDISLEFTEMITTQRGFQANSRVITTSDEMLQELVNIKR